MKVLIRPHAARLSILKTPITPSGRLQMPSKSFLEELEALEGTWQEVETTYLFADQFNIDNLRVFNYHIMQIVDDKRESPTYIHAEQVYSDKDWLAKHPYEAFKKVKGWGIDVDSAARLIEKYHPAPDVDFTIVAKYVYGVIHRCRPIVPLGKRDAVWLGRGYSRQQFKENYPDLTHWRIHG